MFYEMHVANKAKQESVFFNTFQQPSVSIWWCLLGGEGCGLKVHANPSSDGLRLQETTVRQLRPRQAMGRALQLGATLSPAVSAPHLPPPATVRGAVPAAAAMINVRCSVVVVLMWFTDMRCHLGHLETSLIFIYVRRLKKRECVIILRQNFKIRLSKRKKREFVLILRQNFK